MRNKFKISEMVLIVGIIFFATLLFLNFFSELKSPLTQKSPSLKKYESSKEKIKMEDEIVSPVSSYKLPLPQVKEPSTSWKEIKIPEKPWQEKPPYVSEEKVKEEARRYERIKKETLQQNKDVGMRK